MNLLDLLKSAKDLLVGNGAYEDESSYQQRCDNRAEEYVEDEPVADDEDESADEYDGALDEADVSRFEDALRHFYSRLSQKEMDDEDLNKITDQIQDDYFAHKIKNPAKALDDAYRKWKQSKSERMQQRANDRATILEMLDNYENLAAEEKERLTNWDDRCHVRHLKKSDVGNVERIVSRWLQERSLDEGKVSVLRDLMNEDMYVVDEDYLMFENTPLTEADYEQVQALYSLYPGCYKDFMKYAQRYWLNSGNKPKQIDCDDLIVNRPCFLKMRGAIWTPHFHMGKRYFEEDCRQWVTFYLFADALEYIADGGHVRIDLADVIDISINNWGTTNSEEPGVLEITRRNQGKTLADAGDAAQLLILRALMLYFIKNPQ